MGKVIAAVFKDHHDAEKASLEISEYGYNIEKMSVISKNENGKTNKEDGAGDGAIEGSLIGGALGLLLGVGMITVPGLGVFAAAGPLAGILSGALAGGIIGALVDLGIPEEEGSQYEEEITSGRVLWSMPINEKQSTDKLLKLLEKCGALRVNTY